MAEKKTNTQRVPSEGYTNIEMRFLCADKICIIETGEIINITDKMKLAYQYMANQCDGFDGRGLKFYQDQRQMAAALGWSRETFGIVLAGLKKLGIVEVRAKKGNSESYTVHLFSEIASTLEVIHRTWNGKPAWDHKRVSGKKSTIKKPANKEKKEDVVKEKPIEELSVVESEQIASACSEQPDAIQCHDDNCNDDISNHDNEIIQAEPEEFARKEHAEDADCGDRRDLIDHDAYVPTINRRHVPPTLEQIAEWEEEQRQALASGELPF